MLVLVLGASGFIGLPVAQALVRAGHVVYGVTRSAQKAKRLAAEEIIPVVADVNESEDWPTFLKYAPKLDVVIEAIGGDAKIRGLSADLFSAFAKTANDTRPAGSSKLTYIYTSGTWVHGDNREEIVTDTTPLYKPMDLVAWRPAQEQAVVNDSALNGIVIRPALLYGRSASILAACFKSAYEGKVAWYGTPGGRYSLIHADDLAELYVLVAEKAQIVGGKIFDAANDYTESVDDFLEKLVKVSGAKGPYEYITPSNGFHESIACTTLNRPYLGRALLGWQTKKPGLVDGLTTYYAAWKASEGL